MPRSVVRESLEPINMVLSWSWIRFHDTVTRSEPLVMSSRPSWIWYGRPKYCGCRESGLLPSLRSLWSTQTWVAPVSDTASYSEFQLPVSPSVGSHAGKQSFASVIVIPRMITLLTAFSRSAAPVIDEPGRPMIVVLDPIGMVTRSAWACCDARRASSTGPDGSWSRPHTAGSNASRYACSV